jgi:hypothetical protein
MTMIPALLLDDTGAVMAMGGTMMIVTLAIVAVLIVGMWKVFVAVSRNL